MIFPSKDRVLLTQELGTYGVTYSDALDCLFVAPRLKGHPGYVGAVTGVESPLSVVCLLTYGSEHVGALFSPVTQLIECFWNGVLPEGTLGEYISDMADLYLADAKRKYCVDNQQAWQAAVEIHERTRELVRECGSLPKVILERIRESIEFVCTVH